MNNYANVDDVIALFRELTPEEQAKAEALLPVVCDTLRQEARLVGKDLDKMIATGLVLPNVVKSVVVDVLARSLLANTNSEPMTQYSQSALGYTYSGTYLNAGGGVFVKRSELVRLGLKRQRMGVINFV